MAYTYEHNTAHQLRPVKAYDLVSSMDFIAPMANGVSGVMPGTVLHRIKDDTEVAEIHTALGATNPVSDSDIGHLVPGLNKTGMAMFMVSKQDSEDVVNNPGTSAANFTSISMNSYGGFNNAPYSNETDPHTVGDGLATLFGTETNLYSSAAGSTPTIAYSSPKSAYTVIPGACGLELASSEFAIAKGDGTTLNLNDEYAPDTPLTSPTRIAASVGANYGTPAQQLQGGFLQPGTLYTDNICGIVSNGPALNENRTRMIRFWAVYLPAMVTTAATPEVTEPEVETP